MIVRGCVVFERTLLSRKKSHNLPWSCAISNIFYCDVVWQKSVLPCKRFNLKKMTLWTFYWTFWNFRFPSKIICSLIQRIKFYGIWAVSFISTGSQIWKNFVAQKGKNIKFRGVAHLHTTFKNCSFTLENSSSMEQS